VYYQYKFTMTIFKDMTLTPNLWYIIYFLCITFHQFRIPYYQTDYLQLELTIIWFPNCYTLVITFIYNLTWLFIYRIFHLNRQTKTNREWLMIYILRKYTIIKELENKNINLLIIISWHYQQRLTYNNLFLLIIMF